MILTSLDNGIETGAGAFTDTLDIPYIHCGAHLCHLKPAARFKCAPGSAPANRAPGFGNLPVAWISLVPDSRSTKRDTDLCGCRFAMVQHGSSLSFEAQFS